VKLVNHFDLGLLRRMNLKCCPPADYFAANFENSFVMHLDLRMRPRNHHSYFQKYPEVQQLELLALQAKW
jgi:hypothetical protein